MEIELTLGKNNYWREITCVLTLVVMIALGSLGSAVTHFGEDDTALVLTWSDYQLGKAERTYHEERAILRVDADGLTDILSANTLSSPVVVQVAVNRILDHTSSGVSELSEARSTLSDAAQKVRDWSIGIIDKNSAIQAVHNAVTLLME